MSQELEVLTGKLHGLTAALSVIAAALPPQASADVQETLRDMIGETAASDLAAATLASMHSTIAQVIESMEIGLRR
ncbi:MULTISPECIES: hypothetical protein [Caballeronia]|uniref:Uncharacterized protein n=1 Tax=Caballeronia cordobensis TaxID=1353886 RepID=A0A158JG15_CABCO|nr:MULTISPECIES: hypothetical protein [Caballeronia]AET94601.1 hypothetical protein BYI23_D010910 [Burkholderia sp. YI23]BAO92456.1 uncharacterized protein BRPE67_DCDS13010 [Burkholderia sp. RPE67]BBQ01488.1 hypothetical protein BSFA1_66160 [Burkholderia sp. SFA1]MCE4546205.1 hypothetical protein [Caballeronia sp. PC1]MCE4573320.1 hypothetical protein [Caballeronia sp. CLC5]